MIYSDFFTLQSAIGSPVQIRIFSASGLFDPDFSLGGHQPRGFDQLMALYDRYVVTNAKISATFAYSTNNGAETGRVCYPFISVQDNTLPRNAQVYDYWEDGYTNTGILNTNRNESCTVWNSIKPLQFVSHSIGDNTVQGSTSSNPATQCFFHVGTIDSSNAVGQAVICRIQIEYTVKLVEPKLPSAS